MAELLGWSESRYLSILRSYPASRLSAFTFLTPALGVAFGCLLPSPDVEPHVLANEA